METYESLLYSNSYSRLQKHPNWQCIHLAAIQLISRVCPLLDWMLLKTIML